MRARTIGTKGFTGWNPGSAPENGTARHQHSHSRHPPLSRNEKRQLHQKELPLFHKARTTEKPPARGRKTGKVYPAGKYRFAGLPRCSSAPLPLPTIHRPLRGNGPEGPEPAPTGGNACRRCCRRHPGPERRGRRAVRRLPRIPVGLWRSADHEPGSLPIIVRYLLRVTSRQYGSTCRSVL